MSRQWSSFGIIQRENGSELVAWVHSCIEKMISKDQPEKSHHDNNIVTIMIP